MTLRCDSTALELAHRTGYRRSKFPGVHEARDCPPQPIIGGVGHDSQAVALPRHATWIDQARRRAVRAWRD